MLTKGLKEHPISQKVRELNRQSVLSRDSIRRLEDNTALHFVAKHEYE